MKRGRTLKLVDVPPYEALLDTTQRLWNDYKRGKYKWLGRKTEETPLRDIALFTTLVFTGSRLGEAQHQTSKILQRSHPPSDDVETPLFDFSEHSENST